MEEVEEMDRMEDDLSALYQSAPESVTSCCPAPRPGGSAPPLVLVLFSSWSGS